MVAGRRVKSGIYTDSDISLLYINYREKKIGKFIREVGDFIAHSDRDRGVTLEASRYVYSQIAFFQRYLGYKAVVFEPRANCEWWLRDYFFLTMEFTPAKIVRKHLKMSSKEARSIIETWFDNPKTYPTRIECNDLDLLQSVIRLAASSINVKPPFTLSEIKKQVGNMFAYENIPISEFDRFIAGTCVVLAGRTGVIGPGVTGTLALSIDPINKLSRVGAEHSVDGALTINMYSRTDDRTIGLVDIGSVLFETRVDSEKYVSRSFIEKNYNGYPHLNLTKRMTFDSTKLSPIEPLL